MRDRLGYCAKCLVSFTEEPQGNENPDLCLWCEKDLTDVAFWLRDTHAGQTDQTLQESIEWQTR